MHRLEQKHGRRRRHAKGAPAWRLGIGQGEGKHWLIAILLVVGIAVATGLLVGMASGREEVPISAGLGVAMMSAGVFAARKLTNRLGAAAQPRWVQGLVRLGCCGPLLAMAMAPTMDIYRHGPGAFLALLVTALLVRWESRLESGADGEMKIGQAFSAGLCAFIFAAIFTEGHPDELMYMPAAVAVATSFAVQGVAWFVPLQGLRSQVRPAGHRDQPGRTAPTPPVPRVVARLDGVGKRVGQRVSGVIDRMRGGETDRAGEPGGGEPGIPMAIPVEQYSRHARLGSTVPLPPTRHSATRAFWSVLGFLLLAGAVVSFLSTVLVTHISRCPDSTQGLLTVSAACCALLVFALRKTSLRKHPAFWRETLRPFLLTLTAIGIAAPIIALAVQPYLCDEAQLGSISGLILSGVLFVILLFARGRRAEPAPFLLDAGGSGPGRHAADAPDVHARPTGNDDPAEQPAPQSPL